MLYRSQVSECLISRSTNTCCFGLSDLLPPGDLIYQLVNLELISPMCNEQLLQAQIPKVQKDICDLTVYLCFWDLHGY